MKLGYLEPCCRCTPVRIIREGEMGRIACAHCGAVWVVRYLYTEAEYCDTEEKSIISKITDPEYAPVDFI